MEENKYKLAGWLAIAQAVLFPAAVVIGIIEAGVAAGVFNIKKPFIGPSDLLMILFTVIAVYTLLRFRALLHERYEYHGLDLLILISIWWAVLFQFVGLVISVFLMVFWPVDRIVLLVVYVPFFAASMLTIGIVDILIAIKLFNDGENFGQYIRGFAYVTMVAGICEVTVLLSLLSLVLVPASALILALIFFHNQKEVEFV